VTSLAPVYDSRVDIATFIRSIRDRLSPESPSVDTSGVTPDPTPQSEPATATTIWRTEFLSLTLPAEFTLKFHGSSVKTDPLWSGPRIPNTVPRPVVRVEPVAEIEDPFAPPQFPEPPRFDFSPPQFAPPSAIEDVWNWEGTGERELRLTVWKPRAPYPGGPMQAAETWTEHIAGEEVSVTRTSLFFGLSQEVLVLHLNLVEPRAQVLFYASHLVRAEFSAILSSIELTGNSIEPRFSPPTPRPL
jgi:hypothetical protein